MLKLSPDHIRAIPEVFGLNVVSTYPKDHTVAASLLADLEGTLHDLGHVAGLGFGAWLKVLCVDKERSPNVIGEVLSFLPFEARDASEVEAVAMTVLMNRRFAFGLDEELVISGVSCHGCPERAAKARVRKEISNPRTRLLHHMMNMTRYLTIFDPKGLPALQLSAMTDKLSIFGNKTEDVLTEM